MKNEDEQTTEELEIKTEEQSLMKSKIGNCYDPLKMICSNYNYLQFIFLSNIISICVYVTFQIRSPQTM